MNWLVLFCTVPFHLLVKAGVPGVNAAKSAAQGKSVEVTKILIAHRKLLYREADKVRQRAPPPWGKASA